MSLIATVLDPVLPAAAAETLHVGIRWEVDPTTVEWEAAVDDFAVTAANQAPPTGWSDVQVVDRGVLARPRYAVGVPVVAGPPGTFGVWIRSAGPDATARTRFAGRVHRP